MRAPAIARSGSRAAAPGGQDAVTLSHLAQLLFLGAVWGGAFLFLRIASPDVGPVWTAEIRLSIAAGVLAAVAGRRTWRLARGNAIGFLVVGATFGAVPFTLVAVAAATLPAGFAAVLNATTPLFTVMLGVIWLGQRVTRRLVVGLASGLLAVGVLVGWSPVPPGPQALLAVVAALGAALSYAVAGTFVRRRLPGVAALELATGQLAVGAALLLPFAIATGGPRVSSPASVAALVAVATLSTALPWPIYLRLLSVTTPTVASTVTFIVPVFAMAWGALFLGEPVGPGLLLGFGLVVVSLVLVLRIPVPRFAGTLSSRVRGVAPGLAGRVSGPAILSRRP